MTDALDLARATARAWAMERRELERQLADARLALDRVAEAFVDTLELFEGLDQYLEAGSGDEAGRIIGVSLTAAWERLQEADIVVDGAPGEALDHARHRIVREDGSATGGHRTVVSVVSRGIVCGGRRIRPAQVVARIEDDHGSANRH